MPGQILAICQHFALSQKMFHCFLCWSHGLHLLHSASSLEAFHDFVSTICSSIVITFLVLHFISTINYKFHPVLEISCFTFFFFKYSSFCFSSVHFFNLAFIALCNGFQSFVVLSSSSKIFFHWGSCCARLSSHYKT